MKHFIKELLRESLTDDIWYHGTPDVRELEKEGGFTNRNMTVNYISDMNQYRQLQEKIKIARESDNDAEYFKLLDMVPKLKEGFNLRKPIFLTNDIRVAKTYADSRRSVDYQNAVEKLLKVRVKPGKSVTIVATGDRFRFIDTTKVKKGFINAGVKEEDFNEIVEKFTYYQNNDKGIKTDVIAVIGEWFGFDYIDVVGVLDSYEGGSIKSTVRMVYDPNSITVIK